MKLLAMDTETGGLDPSYDVLTVYMAVLDENHAVVDELDLKLKPDNRAPVVSEGAMKVNKIDLPSLLENPETLTYSQAREVILSFLQKNSIPGKRSSFIPLGHNVGFDLNFINAHLVPEKEWRKQVHYGVLDTSIICTFFKFSGLWPKEIGNLGSIVDYLGLTLSNAHDAKADTLATVEVFKKMAALLKAEGSSSGLDDILVTLE